jgi:multidrug transporter EmrE-like cation transporter
MSAWAIASIVVAVIGTVAGQSLFKGAAMSMNASGSTYDFRALWLFATAVVVYGIMSVMWTIALREVTLARAYPFMALSFVLIPIAEHLIYGTPLPTPTLIGASVIAAGIVITQL